MHLLSFSTQSLVRCAAFVACVVSLSAGSASAGPPSLADVTRQVQPKIVKIYGAGGFRGLEAYQSGFLVSSRGHVLTSWSYVLDTSYITVTLNDGRKFEAELVGADPRLEIAVLKIDAENVPFFALDEATEADRGERVLAFSNLYGIAAGNEPASVLHGVVAAKTRLDARRGVFKSTYQGEAYVLDAMTNNPGAAGGALTDNRGRLVGMLGKELRNSLNNTWLNFAVPISALAKSAEAIRSGETITEEPQDADLPTDPATLAGLGIVTIPNLLDKTPPFIDSVRPGSRAARAGLRPDDLVVFVGDDMVQSRDALVDRLRRYSRRGPVRLMVMREQELLDVQLQP
jgi:S1-C subfamily serine protease